MVWFVILLWETIFSRNSVPDPNQVYLPFHSLKNLIYYAKLYGIRNNFIGNILLFIPFGAVFPLICEWGRKWDKILLLGLGMSIIVETVQMITGRGYFDFDDIMLNTIGTAIGYRLWKTEVKLIGRWRKGS